MPDSTSIFSKPARFDIIRRSLHILSLVQNSSSEEWNTRSLSELLSLVPGNGEINEKNISASIKWLKSAGFPIQTGKGARRICLSRELDDDEVIEILSLAISFTVEGPGIRDCFKSYIEGHHQNSLWIITRIYFASLEKRKIKLTYRPESKNEFKEYLLHPYKWIYRDSAVYLWARNEAKGAKALFKLNRIGALSVTDDYFGSFEDDGCDELSESLGAFAGGNAFSMILEYPVSMHSRIVEEFGRMDLSFERDASGKERVFFAARDLISVCRSVFQFGGRVSIAGPKEAREEMKRLISGNSEHY